MRYMYAYRCFFESPKWKMNLVAGSLCILVPYVGPIVFLGYGYEIIESLHRRKDSRYPDFDTNRLTNYLVSGVWPFLVHLVVRLPLGMALGCLGACVGVGSAIAFDDHPPKFVALLFPLLILVALVLALALDLVVIPLSLRAGLTQDFGQAFSLAFVKDFVRRVWLETMLLDLFLLGTNIVLTVAGLLLCLVGVYPAAALVFFAQFPLIYQLYELYLERGGTPVPLKGDSDMPPDAESMPTVEPADPESFRAAEDS